MYLVSGRRYEKFWSQIAEIKACYPEYSKLRTEMLFSIYHKVRAVLVALRLVLKFKERKNLYELQIVKSIIVLYLTNKEA